MNLNRTISSVGTGLAIFWGGIAWLPTRGFVGAYWSTHLSRLLPLKQGSSYWEGARHTHYTWLIKGMCQFSVPVTFWGSFQGYSPGVRLEPPAGCAAPRWVQQKRLGFTACDHRVCWDLEF